MCDVSARINTYVNEIVTSTLHYCHSWHFYHMQDAIVCLQCYKWLPFVNLEHPEICGENVLADF